MKITPFVKTKPHVPLEIIGYRKNAIDVKTILNKSTGIINVISSDGSEGLTEKTTLLDTFAMIIEGNAEIFIENGYIKLKASQSIIIPAHKKYIIKAKGHFKMILSIIKRGCDE